MSLTAGAWFGGQRRVRSLALAAAAAAAAVLASSAMPAGPATLALAPVADASVLSDQPAAKFGTATTLRADGSPPVRSYLRFSVPALPGPVTRALLRVRSSSNHTAGYLISGVADSGWSEAAITFATAPPFAPAPVGSSGKLSSGAWSEVDVTALVGGAGPVSIALTTTSNTAMTLSSREAASASRPQLVITTGDAAPDTTAPSVPSGLTASPAGAGAIALSWAAATDAVGVTGYGVYRDGVLVATTAGATSFTDAGLAPGSTHAYRVDAADAAGNRSARSAEASGTAAAEAEPPEEEEETLTLAPVADAAVLSDQPGAAFGTATTLRADGSPPVRSYLRFSVPALSGPVTRAVLRVRSSVAHSAGYRVSGVADTGWSEAAITFATAPLLAPAPVGASGPLASGAWGEVDVTPLVSGSGEVSMALTTTSNTAMTLSSREAAAASRPQLVITAGEGGPVDGDPVIAAAGDIACDPAEASFADGLGTADYCRQKATSDLLVDADLAAVLALGDIQYFCASSQAFQASYVPSWGRVKSITRPAIGNHEYLTTGQEDGRPTTGCTTANAGAAGYFAYFGAAAGAPTKGYYSYDVGAWHLIALNGECSRIAGGCTASGAQGQWLAADLAAHPATCTLAYFHAPLFSSGGRAVSRVRPFWDLLHAAGADVILNGHDHVYERFAPQTPAGAADPAAGIRQFTVGTGGEQHTFLPAIAANSEVRNATTYGVLKLTLHATGYDWSFVPEAGGSFTDAGSASCH